jgi:hypothetical protein
MAASEAEIGGAPHNSDSVNDASGRLPSSSEHPDREIAEPLV